MKRFLLLCMTVSMTSCIAADHTVVVRNLSSQQVTDLTLKTTNASFGFEFGTLIPNASKGYTGPMKLEKRDVCTVDWKDTLGKPHKADIDLSHEDLKGFNGNLEFILNDSGKFEVKTRKN